MVQWLRFHLPVQGTQVPSMVRSYVPLGQKSEHKTEHVLQKNSIKTLKWSTKNKRENFKSNQRKKKTFSVERNRDKHKRQKSFARSFSHIDPLL